MSDYFKMDRGVYKHPFFSREAYSRRDAWGWLIASACYKDLTTFINGKEVVLKRGQLSFSIRFMAEKWKWDKAKVERCLGALKTATMIETHTEAGQLVITICNYDKYQDVSGGSETETEAGNETAARQQRDSSETKKKAVKAVKAVKAEEREEVAEAPHQDDIFQKAGVEAPHAKPAERKGTRLTVTELPPEWREHCVKCRPDLNPELVWRLFSNYWTGKSGKDATKLDWFRTWDTWVLKEAGPKNATNPQNARPKRAGARTV